MDVKELKQVRGCCCRCNGERPELKEVRGCRCRSNGEGPELKEVREGVSLSM